ncbi:MAG: hypothetical protein JNJ85_09885 [Candidatus Kapabacteria bacterium]|nr:hypothetical protein [Candidatus Kapabacteria bacterium]
MNITLAILCFLLCLCSACTNSTSVTEETFPDKAYKFLYNGKRGTRYIYTTFEKTIDTNGVETQTRVTTAYEFIITQSITNDTNGRTVVKGTIQPYNGFASDWVYNSNDTLLELRADYTSSDSQELLKTPISTTTSFKTSDGLNGNDTTTTSITEVNTTRQVPAGIFRVIGTTSALHEQQTSVDTYYTNKNWYSEGTGVIENQSIYTSIYPSGKKHTHIIYTTLSEISHP